MSELQYQREIFFSFIDTHNAKFMEYAFCNFQLMDKDHKFRELQKKIWHNALHFSEECPPWYWNTGLYLHLASCNSFNI